MNNIIKTISAVVAVIIIILIMMQESKSSGASGALTGGGLNLFLKQKERGLAKTLSNSTFNLIWLFLLLIIILKIA